MIIHHSWLITATQVTWTSLYLESTFVWPKITNSILLQLFSHSPPSPSLWLVTSDKPCLTCREDATSYYWKTLRVLWHCPYACVKGHLEPTHLKSSPLFTFSTKSFGQDSPSIHLFSKIIMSRFTTAKIKLGEDSTSWFVFSRPRFALKQRK